MNSTPTSGREAHAGTTKPPRVLTFTTLYPDSIRPRHGIFVETRLRKLCDTGRAEATVIAPVPWFPFTHRIFSTYGRLARIPRFESRHDISVFRPRYLVIPRVGMSVAPLFLALAGWRALRRLRREGKTFDVIDAHYFYPDGVAATLLGKWLGLPVVITARGTDINLIARFAVPRRWITWAARKAHRLIAVCDALKGAMTSIGIDGARISVLRNGVDMDQFCPVDREATRARLGFSRKTILSVGNLVALKGHDLCIEMMTQLPDADLVIVGKGEEESRLKHLAGERGLESRVRFVPEITQSELRSYYGAADVLVLASSREGMANVLLEAMACGTPVVATAVGGAPEVITSPEAGVLVTDRSPRGLAEGVNMLLGRRVDRAATRRHAEKFSWDVASLGQIEIFNDARGATRAA